MANAISTRLASGISLRDARRPQATSLPGVPALQVQNSRMLAAASKALAAICENVGEAHGTQLAADVEAQARKLRVARGNHLHEADMETLPIA